MSSAPLPTRADLAATLLRRYRGADIEALTKVICAQLVPVIDIEKKPVQLPRATHHSLRFTMSSTGPWIEMMVPGCTGKFIPADFASGNGPWREIAKGRVLKVDWPAGIAHGELYLGSRSTSERLSAILPDIQRGVVLELDQYGASAKVLSGLVEHMLVRQAENEGFEVRRMPADIARHIGAYYYYDFTFEKGGVTQRVEAKSLWGTDTSKARLIHSKGEGYPTSSCKFATQDIFAVSLFLRTGDVRDFAFARSVPADAAPFGLPRASKFPAHVNQNPDCAIGDGTWFKSISEVWNLTAKKRRKR